MTNIINSYKGEYSWLSNMALVEIKVDGIIYPSIENAYCASKTLILKQRIKFETCNPYDAKRLGSKLSKAIILRDDWCDELRLTIMWDLLCQKFYKYSFYRTLLLNTNDAVLIEGNTWGDTFFGICNGKGLNHLGNMQMKIRDLLNERTK